MTPAMRLFKRAMATKIAFVPMPGGEPQASGPGGAPIDPMMDPAAAGGAPMDPAAAGGAPMDPAAMGMDPAAMGMDPAAMGMDPSMMDPSLGAPPAGGEGVTSADAKTVEDITKRTMDIVRQTLEMVGKAKPVEGGSSESASPAPAPAPVIPPGPISGLPGDMSGVGVPGATGIPKMASVLNRLGHPRKSKVAMVLDRKQGLRAFFNGR